MSGWDIVGIVAVAMLMTGILIALIVGGWDE